MVDGTTRTEHEFWSQVAGVPVSTIRATKIDDIQARKILPDSTFEKKAGKDHSDKKNVPAFMYFASGCQVMMR